MYNITKGNVVPMKATLVHDEERFPVGASTGLSVRIYGLYRYIDAVNVAVDQEEDGVLYFDVPATLNYGVYGVEVKGKVNGTPWRTATDCVIKITQSTQRNEGGEAGPEGDTYDITMTVQLYKQQSSDRAIEEHNSDEASHPYILSELERIEGEIPTLPEHIVTDANYVHTDNNYTTEEKTKLANAITEEQDPTVPSWAKQQTKPSYNAQEVGALPANTPLFDGDYNSLKNKPDLSGYITISVNNLVNYYLKGDVYTKTEVANLIAAIQQFHYEIYASISAVTSPAGNVLYLIGPTGTGTDKYEEYVYDATKQEPWVKIGDTSIDLSDYYTKGQTDNAITSALNTALADYTTTAALTLLLAGKQDVINDLSDIRSGAAAGATALQSETDPTVPQWAKQSTKPSYTPQEVGALPANTPLFNGDYNSLTNKPDPSGFITISVNSLLNYYLKSEVYTKTEVANLIAAIQQFHYEIYASISAVASPAGNVLYLIGPVGKGSDKYEEYVYDSTKQEPWVKIGDTSIDLSDYYTKGQTDNAITSALNTALADYTTTAALTLLLAGKQDVINDLSDIRSGASAGATAYQKPQGGIPSTDMSQAVQTSLEKANTALQQHQDISGKENMTTVVAPVNATDATLPITSLTCEIGKYYRLDIPVDTLTVTLPAMEAGTTVKTVVIFLTAGSTPSITIASADSKDVYYQDGFDIEAGNTYEINALFNGAAWVVAAVKINVE